MILIFVWCDIIDIWIVFEIKKIVRIINKVILLNFYIWMLFVRLDSFVELIGFLV